ncbi:hypothetical protein F5880DRAFT_1563186, partial [Lentinula raphanica]
RVCLKLDERSNRDNTGGVLLVFILFSSDCQARLTCTMDMSVSSDVKEIHILSVSRRGWKSPTFLLRNESDDNANMLSKGNKHTTDRRV